MTTEKNNISFLIPVFNEEKNIRFAIESSKWADEIFVVDNFSTDKTVEVAKEYPNVKIIQRPFDGYAKQKNWALDNLSWSSEWIFILDADEQITLLLKEELLSIVNNATNDIECWYVNRKFIFLGKWLKHCGWYPSWNLRFFKRGKARYENRSMDEHMIPAEKIGYLINDMVHEDHKGIAAWIEKHNKYSTLEACERLSKKDTGLQGGFFDNDPIKQKRAIKNIFTHFYFRSIIWFIYCYFVRLGFLDGYAGFSFSILRAIQEFHINLKLKELKLHLNNTAYFDKKV